MSNDTGNPFEGFELIHAYTRQMALADGVLHELKEAPHLGFKLHVAATERVWGSLIAWPFESNRVGLQRVREQALLRAAFLAIKTKMELERSGVPDAQPDRLDFHVRCVLFGDGDPVTKDVQLYALVGPDDLGGPCMTLLYPDED